jgi:hypothetical protein
MMDAEMTYSRAARLRVALSELAAEIADSARSLVPTASDSYAHGGEFAESAAQLAAQARELLTLAVAYERRRGSSWERIGDGLSVSRQSAQERFGEAVRGLDDAIARAWLLDDPRTPGLPEGAGNPGETAERLDRWVLRHLEDADTVAHRPDDDPARDRPVSASLDRMDVLDHIGLVTDAARVVSDQDAAAHGWSDEEQTGLALALEIGLAKRKIELYERMPTENPETSAAADAWSSRAARHPGELDELLAGARARLAELEGSQDQGAEVVDINGARPAWRRRQKAGE